MSRLPSGVAGEIQVMLSPADLAAWAEIQDGLARAAEREFEARVMWAFYERRRTEVAAEIKEGGGAR